MLGDIFNGLVVQPIFNLLVFIYAILPGHNFGLAIIIFTIVVRLLMWPLVKKQLHQAKAMRSLQPEIKRIKKATKGNRQQESALMMELYKERGISPFGSLGTLIVQFVILIGLYIGLTHVIKDPKALLDNSYGFIHSLSWMQTLAADSSRFDGSLFGVIDLTRSVIEKGGGFYLPALLLVLGSAVAQYFQSVQLLPKQKDARSLRQIFKDASSGKQAEQSEVSEAMARNLPYIIPVLVFFLSLTLAAALSLYWMIGGIVAYIQQGRILGKDEEEMEAIADEPDIKPGAKRARQAKEAEIITTSDKKDKRIAKVKKPKTTKKRRKR